MSPVKPKRGTAAQITQSTPTSPQGDAGREGAQAPAAAPAEPMVAIIKTANAPKLSPRGDGQLTYQVGRMADTVLIRIFGNQSAGRFSKEWVAVEAIRNTLSRQPKDADLFKGAHALRGAWKGLSACNAGFGMAILRAEGIFASDPEKKGMVRLTGPTALDDWERKVLAIKVAKDADRVPLIPPKPVPNFTKRLKPEGEALTGDAPMGDAASESGGDPPTAKEAPLPDEEP